MRKIISLLIALAVMLLTVTAISAAWQGEVADSFSGGSGTKGNPYRISSAEELSLLSENVSKGQDYKGKYFILTADIELNDTSNWRAWESTGANNSWKPIGSAGSYFKGSFNGCGYTVSGMYINADNTYNGLFGYVKDAQIKNLNIEKSYVAATDNAGLLVGTLDNSVISFVSVSGTLTGRNNVGGIAGYNYIAKIQNSKSSAEVTGNSFVGGITGCNYRATVSGCVSTETVEAELAGGGIAGENTDSVIETSYSTGNIFAQKYAGGIVGYSANEKSTVSYCYSLGNIEGEKAVGGIAGGSYGKIENSFARGRITGEYAGGIVGVNAPIEPNDKLPDNGDITNCYYVKDRAAGGTGFTVNEDELDIEEVSASKLSDKSYITRYIEFGEYESEENRGEMIYNVWTFNGKNPPMLFFEAEKLTEEIKPVGTKIGEVLHTDITAYINGRAIKAYNINGKMAVALKDLRSYGFEVEFDEELRRVDVRNIDGEPNSSYVPKEDNAEVGSYAMDVLYTDITAYMAGDLCESMNADGYTLIYFRTLSAFGNVTFDETVRKAELKTE